MGEFLPANFASHWSSCWTLFVGDKTTETFLDTDVLHLLDRIFCMPIWLVSDVSLSSFAGLENKFPFIIRRWEVLAEPCAFTSWVLCQERSIKLERKLLPGNFPNHWMLHARFIVDEATIASFNTDLFQLVDWVFLSPVRFVTNVSLTSSAHFWHKFPIRITTVIHRGYLTNRLEVSDPDAITLRIWLKMFFRYLVWQLLPAHFVLKRTFSVCDKAWHSLLCSNHL